MPSRPGRVCGYAGCTAVSVGGSTRCSEHPKAKHNWGSDRFRGTRQARGYGAAWDRLRRQVLERDGGMCQPCRRVGRVAAAVEVDHVLNKKRGGTDELSNLQSICKPCHAEKTAEESRLGGRG